MGLRRIVSDAEIAEALAQVGLAGAQSQLAGTLSAGQRRRLAVARILLSAAPLWILDEPYTNLDAEGTELVSSLIGRHLDAGGAALIAAHHPPAIRNHVARRVSGMPPIDDDLVLGMAREHRDALVDLDERLRDRTFTLKEFVRLVESLPPAVDGDPSVSLRERVAQAAAARADGFPGNPHDEDVVDPLGLPMQSYRAVAWELDEWITRLVDGLFGPVEVRAASEG